MKKKIALITGGSRGIGKAVAESLAKLRYHVILIARNEKKLKEVADEINATGGAASFHSVDITNAFQIQDCVKKTIKEYGQIDVLFNNAGVGLVGTSEVADKDIVPAVESSGNYLLM